MLQKSGRQAGAQGQFALMGSLARVFLPIISGYFEFYIEESSSFSIVLILMAVSSIGVLFHYEKVLYFTIGNTNYPAPNTATTTTNNNTNTNNNHHMAATTSNISNNNTMVPMTQLPINRSPPFQNSHFLLMIFWLCIATIGLVTIFDVGWF